MRAWQLWWAGTVNHYDNGRARQTRRCTGAAAGVAAGAYQAGAVAEALSEARPKRASKRKGSVLQWMPRAGRLPRHAAHHRADVWIGLSRSMPADTGREAYRVRVG